MRLSPVIITRTMPEDVRTTDVGVGQQVRKQMVTSKSYNGFDIPSALHRTSRWMQDMQATKRISQALQIAALPKNPPYLAFETFPRPGIRAEGCKAGLEAQLSFVTRCVGHGLQPTDRSQLRPGNMLLAHGAHSCENFLISPTTKSFCPGFRLAVLLFYSCITQRGVVASGELFRPSLLPFCPSNRR